MQHVVTFAGKRKNNYMCWMDTWLEMMNEGQLEFTASKLYWRIANGVYAMPPFIGDFLHYKLKIWDMLNEKLGTHFDDYEEEVVSPEQLLVAIEVIRKVRMELAESNIWEIDYKHELRQVDGEISIKAIVKLPVKEVLDVLIGLEQFLLDAYCLKKEVIFFL